MLERIKNEPVLLVALFESVIVTALAFGVKITENQQHALLGLAAAILVLATGVRASVTPNSRAK